MCNTTHTPWQFRNIVTYIICVTVNRNVFNQYHLNVICSVGEIDFRSKKNEIQISFRFKWRFDEANFEQI